MLTFRINGKCGYMAVPEKLVSGTIGKQVLFEFSSDWDALQKTAVFMALDGSSHTVCSVEASQELLTIPAAVLVNPEHTLYVQIQGYSDDGTEVINTGRIQGPRIRPGIDPGELPEIDGNNPIWFDIRKQIGDLNTLETSNKSTLVSAINELALSNGKHNIFPVALWVDEEDRYSASASFMEIAQAKAMGNLVLLRYGVYFTHILAGEPTESSFLFEPLLHSVPGIHSYTVDIQDNWSAVPLIEADTSGYETVIYGISDGDAVHNSVMSGKPVYCLLDNLYYLPMIDCREDANIAVFGGCYGSKIITCEFSYGGWTVNTEKIGTDVYALMTKTINESSTDVQVPTAKAVYDAVKGKLDSAELTNAVDFALYQAKESGEFDGEDGISPTVNLEARENGVAISVENYQPGIGMAGVTYLVKHGEAGATGPQGPQGPKGESYTLTDSDKSEIVAAVIESLGGNPVFGYVDKNNNIVVSGNLPDGTYSVKYEMENGTTVNIGNLVLDTNVYYTVTNNLTNCVSNNSAAKAVQGGSYSAAISAKSGYELKSIVVKMGGTDVSSTAVSGGTINIASVTGNIVITAVAEEVKTAANFAGTITENRIQGSTGNVASDSPSCRTTDFVAVQNGDIVKLQGADFDHASFKPHVCTYDSAKKKKSYAEVCNGISNEVTLVDIESTVANVEIVSASVSYLRFDMRPSGANSDIIVNIKRNNEWL